MRVRWSEGDQHGLVWENGLAMVDGSVPVDAARRIWVEFLDTRDLAGFLKLLSTETGSDLLSLPSFAIAMRSQSGEWHLAARGDLQVRVDDVVVAGAGISTWAERMVSGGASLLVGPLVDEGRADDDERPIIAGLVPARALAWGRDVSAVAPLPPVPAEQIAPLPVPGGPVPDAVESGPDAVAPVPDPFVPVADLPLPLPSPAMPTAGELETLAPDLAEDVPAAGSDEAPPAPEDWPAGPVDWQRGPADAEPAPAASDLAEPAPAASAGRFARQYGETQYFSVEDAAVREPDEFISAVPGGSRPATMVPPPAARPGASGLDVFDYEDRDGHTVMMSAQPLADAASVPPPDAPVGGPEVLGVQCGNGHANPPQRSVCSVCGGPLEGEARRLPRPSLGTLVLPNGERLDLTQPVIVGRNPRVDRVQASSMPTLVPLSQGHVSGTHLAIRLEEWNVLAVDLHSTNGTYLRRHGEAPVRLGERPELLVAGDVLDLGHGVQITVESLR